MDAYTRMIFKSEYGTQRKFIKSSKWTSTLIILGMALITRVLLFFAAKNPMLVEKLYSSNIYPYIAQGIGIFISLAPFSIAEIFLIFIVFLILTGIIILIFKPKLIFNNIISILHYVVRTIAIMYVLFYFLWGFNYYRLDLSVLANMSDEPGTFDELRELSLEMIYRSNSIRENLLEDEFGIFLVEDGFHELNEIAQRGFENIVVGALYLGGNYGPAKPVMLSKYMSYTGIMGIYIPFTTEPNINADIPYQNLLSTISHEIAHQRGFAKEEEANFLAYKANTNNSDERFQYSGYYLAMQYLMNEVYNESREEYFLLYTELSDAVKRDMENVRGYWQTKEGKVEEAVTTMNDNYLKANNQKAGIRSYNGVVKLLLSEYKELNRTLN